MRTSFAPTLGLLVALLPEALASSATAAMSSSLLRYVDSTLISSSPETSYHYGPGYVTFTQSSLSITSWNVSTSDPASYTNRIFIPMDLSGHKAAGKVYYTLSSITVSGWLELEPGTSVNGIGVEVLSGLSEVEMGPAGSTLFDLAAPKLIPTEGSDGAGYVGPFSTTSDCSYDKATAAAEKAKLCSGGLSTWDMELMINIDLLPRRSKSPVAKVAGTDEEPLMITLEAEWHDC